VDVFAAVGANEKAAAVTEPGEGALDDPTVATEPGAVLGLASRDHGFDAAFPEQTAVLVVVVAAVGDQGLGSTPRAAGAAADGRHTVEQLHQLSDVVAVAACERPRKWDPAAVYEQMMLAACPAAVNRAGTRLGAPFFTCRWLESAIARSNSS
jgi:hypothetical protein